MENCTVFDICFSFPFRFNPFSFPTKTTPQARYRNARVPYIDLLWSRLQITYSKQEQDGLHNSGTLNITWPRPPRASCLVQYQHLASLTLPDPAPGDGWGVGLVCYLFIFGIELCCLCLCLWFWLSPSLSLSSLSLFPLLFKATENRPTRLTPSLLAQQFPATYLSECRWGGILGTNLLCTLCRTLIFGCTRKVTHTRSASHDRCCR